MPVNIDINEIVNKIDQKEFNKILEEIKNEKNLAKIYVLKKYPTEIFVEKFEKVSEIIFVNLSDFIVERIFAKLSNKNLANDQNLRNMVEAFIKYYMTDYNENFKAQIEYNNVTLRTPQEIFNEVFNNHYENIINYIIIQVNKIYIPITPSEKYLYLSFLINKEINSLRSNIMYLKNIIAEKISAAAGVDIIIEIMSSIIGFYRQFIYKHKLPSHILNIFDKFISQVSSKKDSLKKVYDKVLRENSLFESNVATIMLIIDQFQTGGSKRVKLPFSVVDPSTGKDKNLFISLEHIEKFDEKELADLISNFKENIENIIQKYEVNDIDQKIEKTMNLLYTLLQSDIKYKIDILKENKEIIGEDVFEEFEIEANELLVQKIIKVFESFGKKSMLQDVSGDLNSNLNVLIMQYNKIYSLLKELNIEMNKFIGVFSKEDLKEKEFNFQPELVIANENKLVKNAQEKEPKKIFDEFYFYSVNIKDFREILSQLGALRDKYIAHGKAVDLSNIINGIRIYLNKLFAFSTYAYSKMVYTLFFDLLNDAIKSIRQKVSKLKLKGMEIEKYEQMLDNVQKRIFNMEEINKMVGDWMSFSKISSLIIEKIVSPSTKRIDILMFLRYVEEHKDEIEKYLEGLTQSSKDEIIKALQEFANSINVKFNTYIYASKLSSKENLSFIHNKIMNLISAVSNMISKIMGAQSSKEIVEIYPFVKGKQHEELDELGQILLYFYENNLIDEIYVDYSDNYLNLRAKIVNILKNALKILEKLKKEIFVDPFQENQKIWEIIDKLSKEEVTEKDLLNVEDLEKYENVAERIKEYKSDKEEIEKIIADEDLFNVLLDDFKKYNPRVNPAGNIPVHLMPLIILIKEIVEFLGMFKNKKAVIDYFFKNDMNASSYVLVELEDVIKNDKDNLILEKVKINYTFINKLKDIIDRDGYLKELILDLYLRYVKAFRIIVNFVKKAFDENFDIESDYQKLLQKLEQILLKYISRIDNYLLKIFEKAKELYKDEKFEEVEESTYTEPQMQYALSYIKENVLKKIAYLTPNYEMYKEFDLSNNRMNILNLNNQKMVIVSKNKFNPGDRVLVDFGNFEKEAIIAQNIDNFKYKVYIDGLEEIVPVLNIKKMEDK